MKLSKEESKQLVALDKKIRNNKATRRELLKAMSLKFKSMNN